MCSSFVLCSSFGILEYAQIGDIFIKRLLSKITMARSQDRSQRKASGGRYWQARTKKKFELAGFAANTKVDEKSKVRSKRVIGGNAKQSLLTVKEVNVTDTKGKTQKAVIENVIENPANPNLVGRNIVTKGAVVETKLGKVKVTSRPGQEAVVNGVLI